MTKLEKLIIRFNAGGDISFRELQSVLEIFGFRLDRVAGSHHIYIHVNVTRPMSVQPDGKSAKRYQVRQLRAMIEEFQLHPKAE